MSRLLATAVLALSACATGNERPTMWATLDGKPPLIIAHRGASGYRPEHTLEAYALAVDMGADVVEPDLVFSKDGVLVARHDRYLSTTTDVADHPEFAARKRANDDPADTPREDWWVEDFTLAELKTLRAAQPFPGRSKEFDGLYEIATFDEMLALVARKSKEAGRPVGVYPETKHPGFYASKGYDFEAPLLKALEKFNAGPVFIQSFEPEMLKRLKGKTSAKLVQLVYEDSPGGGPNIPLEEIVTYADGIGAQKSLLFYLPSEFVIGDYVRNLHGAGLFVHFWTMRNDQPNLQITRFAEEGSISKSECPQPESRECAFEDRLLKAEERAAPELELEIFFSSRADGVFADFPDTAVAARMRLSAENDQ